MTYWKGAGTSADRKNTSSSKLTFIDQFFSVLLRLKVGLFVQDVADRFNVSVGTYSKYVTTCICLLFEELKEINPFPSREIIKKTMPDCFKKYPDLRIIID